MVGKSIKITVDADDYTWLKTHYIRITQICADAIKMFIGEERAKLAALRLVIPSNCTDQAIKKGEQPVPEHDIHE